VVLAAVGVVSVREATTEPDMSTPHERRNNLDRLAIEHALKQPPCHICGHPYAAYGPCDHPGTFWELPPMEDEK
jgi:hypothetical protein